MQRRTRLKPRRETPRTVHSERTAHITGHKRERLRNGSKAREKRRAEVFARAGGYCEEKVIVRLADGREFSSFCTNRATEWSHMRHGANKCDCLDPRCNIASCAEHHRARHNAGGKPCPKKVLQGESNVITN